MNAMRLSIELVELLSTMNSSFLETSFLFYCLLADEFFHCGDIWFAVFL